MDSRQRIKDRIIKRAARAWGYADNEIEANFDPIVSLLLEACSAELEKLYAEVGNSRNRVVEQLIDIMSPNSSGGHLPAHAVLQAIPNENNITLKLDEQFLVKKQLTTIYDPTNPITKTLYFGGTAPITLTKATIKYTLFTDQICQLYNYLYSEPIHTLNQKLPTSIFWIGIEVPEDIEKIETPLFYTNTRNTYHRDFYFHNLAQAKIYINDKIVPFKTGLNTDETLNIESIITHNFNNTYKIYQDINEFYQRQFFYLDTIVDVSELETPQELLKITEGTNFKLPQNILWVKIQFPEIMVAEVLDEMQIGLNCFPVINKQIHRISQNINEYINYIPLETEDNFLDILSISDSQGNTYHINQYHKGELQEGGAVLRHRGVARLEQRSASEYIGYLITVLKDEAASFSVLGNNFVDNQLKQLHKLIATLEQQMLEKQGGTKTSFPYLIIKSKIKKEELKNDFFTVDYLSSAGEQANQINFGTHASLLQGASFDEDSIQFITSTVGGQGVASAQDKINSYREQLLTKGRIVTPADVKALCFSHFKGLITSVEVKKGTEKDKSLSRGFVRTIEIVVEKNETMSVTTNEWQYLIDSFLQKLQKQSSNVYPYKIIEKQKLKPIS